MVIDPHDTNHTKTEQKRQIRRPRFHQSCKQGWRIRRVIDGWNMQVEHQQRDRNRKHAIAEGFDTACFLFSSDRRWCVVLVGTVAQDCSCERCSTKLTYLTLRRG